MANIVAEGKAHSSLLCRVHTRLCALPLAQVIETMRPLPIEPIADAARFVCGVAVIRGVPVPVVDAARLLGTEEEPHPARFVTLRTGTRRIALAVTGVLGIRAIPDEAVQQLPPLLRDAGADVVAAIGRLDSELLLVLRSLRIIPNELWATIEAQEPLA